MIAFDSTHAALAASKALSGAEVHFLTIPVSLLFMNSGVKLVTGEEEQIIDSVRKLEDRGVEVLVCGTCLDFYGVKGQLKAGEVSSMYDILGRMQETSKVITL